MRRLAKLGMTLGMAALVAVGAIAQDVTEFVARLQLQAIANLKILKESKYGTNITITILCA